MRGIKFKAWNVDDRVMLYSDFNAMGFYSKENPEEIAENTETVFMYHDYTGDSDFVLLQYTGLKDKSGNEIYEGDVVPLKTKEETSYEWVEDVSKNYVIKFINGGFALHKDGVMPYGSWYWLHDKAHVIEVIGNIYENPELIKSSIKE